MPQMGTLLINQLLWPLWGRLWLLWGPPLCCTNSPSSSCRPYSSSPLLLHVQVEVTLLRLLLLLFPPLVLHHQLADGFVCGDGIQFVSGALPPFLSSSWPRATRSPSHWAPCDVGFPPLSSCPEVVWQATREAVKTEETVFFFPVAFIRQIKIILYYKPESWAGGRHVSWRHCTQVCWLTSVTPVLWRRSTHRESAWGCWRGCFRLEKRQEEHSLCPPSGTSSEQRGLLQRALQVPVHLDVAVTQIHAHLVEAFDQPGPVCTPKWLYTEWRDGRPPLMALLSATRRTHLQEETRFTHWF